MIDPILALDQDSKWYLLITQISNEGDKIDASMHGTLMDMFNNTFTSESYTSLIFQVIVLVVSFIYSISQKYIIPKSISNMEQLQFFVKSSLLVLVILRLKQIFLFSNSVFGENTVLLYMLLVIITYLDDIRVFTGSKEELFGKKYNILCIIVFNIYRVVIFFIFMFKDMKYINFISEILGFNLMNYSMTVWLFRQMKCLLTTTSVKVPKDNARNYSLAKISLFLCVVGFLIEAVAAHFFYLKPIFIFSEDVSIVMFALSAIAMCKIGSKEDHKSISLDDSSSKDKEVKNENLNEKDKEEVQPPVQQEENVIEDILEVDITPMNTLEEIHKFYMVPHPEDEDSSYLDWSCTSENKWHLNRRS